MSDRWVVALAASAVAGALRPSGTAAWVGLLLAVGAVAARRPAWLCLAALVLTSALAGRAVAGLAGLPAGPVVAEVTLLTDPVPGSGGVRADVRLDRRHLELRAAGPSAAALAPRLAGERIRVRGVVEPVRSSPWLLSRHVAGRLRVHAVEGWRAGGALSRAANALRRTLLDGASTLPPGQRSLYTGVVIGDDRAQPAELTDDFRGAGLAHLLAVSGQNVAFTLAAAGPVLRRLRIWPRLGVTLAVIGGFGLVTRFEPSVLRAASMAALAVTLGTFGGPVARLRALLLAITGLLLVDPLLVRSVGFQLSCAATVAIVVASPRLAAALPGPSHLRDALAVTLAAQLGVAPVLLATFGPVPVASLPANLLAVPAAGPVMMWGLTGGVLAGLVGGTAAELLHAPTRLLLGWIGEVARRSSALPLGELRAPHLVVLAGGLALAVRPRTRWLGLSLGAAAVAASVIVAQAAPPLRAQLQPGVVRWHAGSTDVIVLGGAGGRSPLGESGTLAALRADGVGAIALLVVADPSVRATVVRAVEARHPVGTILTTAGVHLADRGEGARPAVVAPRSPTVVVVGRLQVRLTSTADRLVVDARPTSVPESVAEPPR